MSLELTEDEIRMIKAFRQIDEEPDDIVLFWGIGKRKQPESPHADKVDDEIHVVQSKMWS